MKIRVEGVPGAGKTTTIRAIAKALRDHSLTVEVLSIDSAPDAEQFLAQLDRIRSATDPRRIQLLWDRRQMQCELVDNSEADIVIADRLVGTPVAYDRYGGQMTNFPQWIMERLREDDDEMTLWFDLSWRVARDRKQSRTMRNAEYADRVEAGFRTLAQEYGWVRINASRSREEVANQCIGCIQKALGLDW